MHVVLYLNGCAPKSRERHAINALENRGHRVEQLNGNYFDRPQDCDLVVAERAEIRSAYEARGVTVLDFGLEDTKGRTPEEPKPPAQVTHRFSKNGFWTVWRDGEVFAKGRGQSDFDRAIERAQNDED